MDAWPAKKAYNFFIIGNTKLGKSKKVACFMYHCKNCDDWEILLKEIPNKNILYIYLF